jgi:hypothetical protein
MAHFPICLQTPAAKRAVKSVASVAGSLAAGVMLGAAWLFSLGGDSSQLMSASAVIAMSTPFLFLRARSPSTFMRP